MVAATFFVKGCPTQRHLNWGEHECLVLPRIGESVGLRSGGQIHYGTVVSVEHQPKPSTAASEQPGVIVSLDWRVSYDDK